MIFMDLTLYISQQSPYHASCDTAFGAKKDQGQKVVFLGPLKNIPFKQKEELNSKLMTWIDVSVRFPKIRFWR
jgi:hypothetical protein